MQAQAQVVGRGEGLAGIHGRLDAPLAAGAHAGLFPAQRRPRPPEQLSGGLVGLGALELDERLDHLVFVLGHQPEAVVEHRPGGVDVQRGLAGHLLDDGAGALRLGQPESLENADPHPPDVELPPFLRELRGIGVGVMVVVQFLAADDDAPRQHVGAGVRGFVVAVAPEVADAIDHARRQHRNPEHLHRPDRQADETEQEDVDASENEHTGGGKAGVQVALHPVVGAAGAVALDRGAVSGRRPVGLRAFPENRAQALPLRTVGVVVGFGVGVVLAVHGHPFPGDHARGDPRTEAEAVLQRRVQVQRPMRGVTVQIDRHGDDGDVRGD